MKSIEQIKLKEGKSKALFELKEKLLQGFSDADIIIYSSEARDEDEGFSDIGFLILAEFQIDRTWKEEITEIVYDVELNILNN